MKCSCGGRFLVDDTRQDETTNETYRQKRCERCNKLIYTGEFEVECTDDFLEKWYSLDRTRLKRWREEQENWGQK